MAPRTINAKGIRLQPRELLVIVLTTLMLIGVVALLSADSELMRFWPSRSAAADDNSVPDKKSTTSVSTDRSVRPFGIVVESADAHEQRIAQRIETGSEAQEPRPSARSESPAHLSPAAHEPWIGRMIETVACVFAGAIVAPLVFALCLFVMLRRYGDRFGALIQIHNAIAPAIAASPSPAMSQPYATPRVEINDRPSFSLPSEPAEEAGGDSLFEHLFAETLELQSQLDAFPAAQAA
jgi:hypothetical protein